ncbi:hypothetical protein BaRGS_00027190, partial [Batillaria attramentaria]
MLHQQDIIILSIQILLLDQKSHHTASSLLVFVSEKSCLLSPLWLTVLTCATP